MNGTILHVTDAFAPEAGGVERVVECLAAAQVRRGYRVIVLTKAVADAPLTQDRADGIRVVRYRHATRFAPWVYLTSYRHGKRQAAELLRHEKPDLVHYHLTLASQGPLSALPRELPSVYSFYGPWHAEFSVEVEEMPARSGFLYGAYLRAQMAMQRRMQTRLLNGVRRIAVLSDFSREWIARLAPHRTYGVEKIPGGIDTERFTPGPRDEEMRRRLDLPADAFVVFTLRRLVRRMGIDLLIDAVADLKTERPVWLLVGGKGPLRDALEEQARQRGIADRVRFLGFVPDEDLPRLYRAADLFVVPTRAEENFGLIVLEAAACGTPVAATPAGSLPEVLAVADDRYLAGDVTAAALSEVITRAMSDGEHVRRHIREEVAPHVRREYVWETVADKFDALYRDAGVS
ncbi:MAG: glycosyltransferase family 4 protein [Candidatus Lernaella stagnicola]|nr:glycosyltransferase family 4 protein [Candidatus Lernaella stagnicola]